MKQNKKINNLLSGLVPAAMAKAFLFIPTKPKYYSSKKR